MMLPTAGGLTAKLIIAGVFAVSCFLLGMGTHKTVSDRKIAQLQRGWAEERTKAAEATAAAEADARRIEKGWRDHVAAREKEYALQLALRDDRMRRLAASNSSLQQHVDAFAKYTGPAGDSTRPCGNFQDRLETLGVLLGERDRMAGESEQAADDLGDELRLCRGYAEGLRPRR